jgi:hypothetical protein
LQPDSIEDIMKSRLSTLQKEHIIQGFIPV